MSTIVFKFVPIYISKTQLPFCLDKYHRTQKENPLILDAGLREGWLILYNLFLSDPSPIIGYPC